VNASNAVYPTTMPNPIRLADGSVMTIGGGVLPFAASCPPETTPDGATRTCVPFPGARNINYECGGVLVPPGAPGCAANAPQQLASFMIEALTINGIEPAWPGCLCSAYQNDERHGGAAASAESGQSSPASFDAKFACFLVAVAVIAAFTRK